MKKVQFIFPLMLMALAILLSACSGDSFKIDGNIAGLKGPVVRVVFYGDSGMVDELVNVDKKTRFTYKGQSSQPVLVHVLNQDGSPLITVVAANGDHIKLKGDAGKAMDLKVKGSKVNEAWQLFRDEHKAFYTDPNPSRLDAAIEKYVREHPTDMLSTVLILSDYSDYSDEAKLNQLLESIDIQARPVSLTQTFINSSQDRRKAPLPRLLTLNLFKHNGDFEEIKLTDRITFISLWANPQKNRNSIIEKLNGQDDEADGKYQVIDVLTEADTLRWHQTIAADPKSWQHYWAPGGPLEQGIQLLGIKSMPWYAVADSTGLVTYSGPNLDTAIRIATSRH